MHRDYNIKVDDIVQVKEDKVETSCFVSSSAWVVKNIEYKDDISRYAYGDYPQREDSPIVGTVLAVAPNTGELECTLAYIKVAKPSKHHGKCFLYEVSALEQAYVETFMQIDDYEYVKEVAEKNEISMDEALHGIIEYYRELHPEPDEDGGEEEDTEPTTTTSVYDEVTYYT